MAVKEMNPRTPGLRGRIAPVFDELTTDKPEKSLMSPLHRKGGRGARGRVSVRHKGGGHKKLYRIIDFKRDKDNVSATVMSIEYDPNRNARIALLKYSDGEKRYILAPLGVKVGEDLMSGIDIEIKSGNCSAIKNIPVGAVLHNIEMVPGRGGQLARSAGAGVSLIAKEGQYAIIKLNSGEERYININCKATIGQIGNLDAKNVKYGKAGRRRWLGIKPTVRGVAMNPCDHPHGGGEGKSPIGRPGPVTPWGKPTLGYKTRHKRKPSDRFILNRAGGAK